MFAVYEARRTRVLPWLLPRLGKSSVVARDRWATDTAKTAVTLLKGVVRTALEWRGSAGPHARSAGSHSARCRREALRPGCFAIATFASWIARATPGSPAGTHLRRSGCVPTPQRSGGGFCAYRHEIHRRNG